MADPVPTTPDQIAKQAAAQNNFYPGMPQYPDYIGMDPNQLLVGPAGQKYNAEAMRNGPSLATLLAIKNQGKQANLSADQLRKQANSTAADAKNAVSMKGGLNSGQGGIINMEAGNNALEVGQNARSNAATNIGNLEAGDENSRMNNLATANGMNDQQLTRQQLENTKRNTYNLEAYKTATGAWAANQQAAATANSGKK